ncbi:MAG TPA: hypothetical protein VFI20_03360 [Terracidiphilus sp.]|nr:hypothetical protein [Terracidiphilus sp.]
MNRWAKAGEGWNQMITGHPLSSSYFWMAAITSLGALLGIAKAAVQIAGDRHALMVWGPSLLGALVILCLAAAAQPGPSAPRG